uniref:Uncharacterized protein n=1 Tax=Salix viminalis TaxID=40686 RepID=A0A6N2N716_SALVM
MVGVGSPLLMEIKSIHVSCRSYSPSKRVLTFAVSTPQSTSQLSLHNSLPLRQNGFASSDTLDFDQRWVQFFSVSRPNFYRLLSLLSPSLVIFPSQSLQKPLLHPPFTASPTARASCLAFYSVCKAVNDKLGDLFEFRRDLERIVVWG